MIQVITIPLMADNYSYLLLQGSCALVVDPGQARPVLQALHDTGASLEAVLLTHHHFDHCGGARTVQQATGCAVVRAQGSREPATRTVAEGDTVACGTATIQVIATPGHTTDHICFYAPGMLFTGDTLFSGGCGRLFEGTAAQMHESLQKLAALPSETLVYCGHEYTADNYLFAASIEPDNQDIADKLQQARQATARGEATIPSTLKEERALNPFLRTTDKDLQRALALDCTDPVTVFAELRKRKDVF